MLQRVSPLAVPRPGLMANASGGWFPSIVRAACRCLGDSTDTAGDPDCVPTASVTLPLTRRPHPAPVPQTRLGRLARIGLAAAELAAVGALEGLRGLARSDRGTMGSAVFSARNAQRLAARLAQLRGAAMKLGQIVSLQGEDMLPPEFAQALAVLRSGAAPIPTSQLRRVLGREYGKGWEACFAHFDFE